MEIYMAEIQKNNLKFTLEEEDAPRKMLFVAPMDECREEELTIRGYRKHQEL
jgi:hypothetical protein